MYNVSADVSKAWEDFLVAVMAGLRNRGWNNAMEIVRPESDLLDFWQSSNVLLAQTCGYPYVTLLKNKVRLIATPAFDFPGCNGPNYVSFFVVRDDAEFDSLESLRGKCAVINQPHSQSGMNALRDAIAPLAHEGRFFDKVLESGSHLASLNFVQRGDADVAAIDCVTFGLARQYAPKWVEGIRVLGHSKPTPGLPLISSVLVTDEQAGDLRQTLEFLKTSVPELLRKLSVSGFEVVPQSSYGVIGRQAKNAENLGYPNLN